MKKFVVLLLVGIGTMCQVPAQLFSPESFSGAVLGGITGAVIGHNSGRHGGEGAAIGAGIGWLLGSIAHESRAERGYYSFPYYGSYRYGAYGPSYSYYPYRSYYAPTVTYEQSAPAPAPTPQKQVTIINNNYYNTPSSSMSGANSLFGR